MRPTQPLFLASLNAPKAEKRPHTQACGDHQVKDDYAWLRAENWREVMQSPQALPADIRKHLMAENAYCDNALEDTEALQKKLVDEMRARIREDDADVPMEDGQYAYFYTYDQGSEHPLYARCPVKGDAKLSDQIEPVLDANVLASNHDYFDLGGVTHSPDHRYVAYATDCQGSEFYDIRIRDIKSGKDLPDRITSAATDLVWAADSASLYWVWRDKNNRPKEVRLHRLGQSQDTDPCIYHEEDEGFFLNLSQTSDRHFILIEANDHSTSEVHILNAHISDPYLQCMAPREKDLEYHVDHSGSEFYILTNADGAEDFKIVTAPDTNPGRTHWRDLVPAKPGIRRLEQRLFRNHMVWLERVNALPRLIVRRLSDGVETEVTIKDEAYSLGLEPLLDFDTRRMRFCFSSLSQPEQVFDYDLDRHTRALRKTQEIPSGHDADMYCVKRLMANAHDGESIPVSLMYHKDTPIDGTAPLLLYGYGSYGITIPASFSIRRLSLLDRGFVYAIAHIRGGEAKGHAWYKAAKGIHKPNTFHDFIAVARTLISKGYTTERKIIAMGGSAGGLLVGAVLNMAPELFGGAIAAVPFVDVLNTMCDETLPLTPPEWPEWGNPKESAAAYAAIAAYSPYDNVSAQNYPPLLATAGLTDPRVTYWEPAKWVARLREIAPDAGPYLLQTEMQAGHGGMSGRFEGLKTTAMEYAFAIKATGLSLR
ncbi:MAG: S9 family peptidase [Robiginitomaculum sp.]|nr:MAG: S9 family peptidase [Robiginitomaculum sp.]